MQNNEIGVFFYGLSILLSDVRATVLRTRKDLSPCNGKQYQDSVLPQIRVFGFLCSYMTNLKIRFIRVRKG